MKKTLFLNLLLAVTVLVNVVNAQDTIVTPSGHILYVACGYHESGGITIVHAPNHEYDSLAGDLVIPDSASFSNWGVFPVVGIGREAFMNCTGLTSVVLPNIMTIIDEKAFAGCTGLTSVSIPNTVTEIGELAFQNCYALASITLPNSLSGISKQSFANCTSLTTVSIPNSVTSIGAMAFAYCTNLTTVQIGSGVNSISMNRYTPATPFSFCPNLDTITVAPANSHFDSRNGCNAIIETGNNKLWVGSNRTVIPNTVTSIGNDAFRGSGLTSIVIPNSVQSIGMGAFENCTALTSVTLGDNITSIENTAFNSTAISTITIPATVTYIGRFTFYGCSNLHEVVMLPRTPPALSLGGSGVDWGNNTTIYVHCGCLFAYDSLWTNLHHCHFAENNMDVSLTLEVDDPIHGTVAFVEQDGSHVSCADSSAIIIATAAEHYTFDHWSNGSTNNPDTLYLIGDSTVTAYFVANHEELSTVSITANVEGVAELYGTGQYRDGDTVEIGYSMLDTTTEGGHWQFLGWSDGPTETPRSIVVTSDTTIIALFEWVSDSVGIDETENREPGIVIYPNPTFGRMTIASIEVIVAATLTDLTGRCAQVRLTPEGTNQYTLDLTPLPQSTYFLTLTTADGQTHTVRLLKQSDIFGQ